MKTRTNQLRTRFSSGKHTHIHTHIYIPITMANTFCTKSAHHQLLCPGSLHKWYHHLAAPTCRCVASRTSHVPNPRKLTGCLLLAMDPERASTQAANLDNLDASCAKTSRILDQWYWSNHTGKKWESFIDDNVIKLLAISCMIKLQKTPISPNHVSPPNSYKTALQYSNIVWKTIYSLYIPIFMGHESSTTSIFPGCQA